MTASSSHDGEDLGHADRRRPPARRARAPRAGRRGRWAAAAAAAGGAGRSARRRARARRSRWSGPRRPARRAPSRCPGRARRGRPRGGRGRGAAARSLAAPSSGVRTMSSGARVWGMTGRNASATATFGVLPWLGPRMPRTILLSPARAGRRRAAPARHGGGERPSDDELRGTARPARSGHARRRARRDRGPRRRCAAGHPLLEGRRAAGAVARQAGLRRGGSGLLRLECLRADDRGRAGARACGSSSR